MTHLTALPARAALVGLAIALWSGAPARAAEVSGTAYALIYRGGGPGAGNPGGARDDTPNLPFLAPARRTPTRPPPAAATPVGAGMRLLDGRTGRELARAGYDRELQGYLFSLPLNVDVPAGGVCLLLKDAGGHSLPMRDESPGDDGYAFRNPLWEAELQRTGELRELRSELTRLSAQVAADAQESRTLDAARAAQGAPATCELGAPLPEPPRPATALSEGDARAVAGGVCAARWDRFFRSLPADGARFFADAGLAADWAAREATAPVAQALTGWRMPISDGDAQVVADAAIKGNAYLEHAEGLRLLSSAQAACRTEVVRLTGIALAQWESARTQARSAPQRALQQCEASRTRADQLHALQPKALAYQAELQRRITALDGASPPATQAQRVERLACKDL